LRNAAGVQDRDERDVDDDDWCDDDDVNDENDGRRC
jgi:hypothetical protein